MAIPEGLKRDAETGTLETCVARWKPLRLLPTTAHGHRMNDTVAERLRELIAYFDGTPSYTVGDHGT